MKLQTITKTDVSKTTILIRLMVGAVFLFADTRGGGRFEKIGLPYPEFLGSFVGTFEVICGFLLLIGLFTRLASLPLIVIMLWLLQQLNQRF